MKICLHGFDTDLFDCTPYFAGATPQYRFAMRVECPGDACDAHAPCDAVTADAGTLNYYNAQWMRREDVKKARMLRSPLCVWWWKSEQITPTPRTSTGPRPRRTADADCPHLIFSRGVNQLV